MKNCKLDRIAIKFKPIYKTKVWGGENFKKLFNRPRTAQKNIGESWEISALSPDISVDIFGNSINHLITLHPKEFLGEKFIGKPFPLLYKFIDAHDSLSVQVHPNDTSKTLGKTECWYVIDADENAEIIVGLNKKLSKNDLDQSIRSGTITSYLNKIPVKKGDLFFIPSGTVHAILKGTLLFELQESSDTTYRISDWNRKGLNGEMRKLHLSESIETINLDAINIECLTPETIEYNKLYSRKNLVTCDYFTLEEWNCFNSSEISLPKNDAFSVITIIKGNAKILCEDGDTEAIAGETLFIPAVCNDNLSIRSTDNCKFLYSIAN